MTGTRTGNSIRNTVFVLCEQIVCNVLSFACRTVFIARLEDAYLGFSGLFSDVLTLLSLAELGVGTAITYSMYKPAAQGDDRKLGALLNLYRRFYRIIGAAMTAVGLGLTPFLGCMISDIPQMPELPVIYILYLLNTTASYFFAYKRSILVTDQRSHIISLIHIIATSLMNAFQIAALALFGNYILYLALQLLFTLANNAAVSLYVDRRYPQLKRHAREQLGKAEQKEIFANIKAMFLSKISSAVVTSTDNLIISAFVSTITLGLYSNYILFINMIRTIVTKLFGALHGSVGNLIASEKPEKVYAVFRRLWFANFWLVGLAASALYVLIDPFIKLWIGERYLLDSATVFIICLNLYMRLIRNTFLTFIDTYGLFRQLQVKCVCEALINLVVSLIFVVPLDMGIYGVLLGTLISNLATNFWYEPYLLYKKMFGVPWREYLLSFAKYLAVTLIAAAMAYGCCARLIPWDSWLGFGAKAVVCVMIVNGVYAAAFRRTEEFGALRDTMVSRLRRAR